MKELLIDDYVLKYLAEKLKGATGDEIVAFYVKNFIFKNQGYLDHLIEKYNLPRNDMLKMQARIEAIAP